MTAEMPMLSFEQLAEHYLGLESLEVTEVILDLCGATIDKRALPLLNIRLGEEQAQVRALQARGYIRMREKSEQLVACLKPLIVVLEQTQQDREGNQR